MSWEDSINTNEPQYEISNNEGGRPKLTWTEKDCRGSSRQLTLKKGAPGDQV